jgi:hypothetical protein
MLQRFQQLAREVGLANAVTYASGRLLRKVSFGRVKLRKYLLVAQPVAAQNMTPPRRGTSIEIHEATPDEVRSTDFGRPHDVIDYRLRHRCRCLTARKGGELLGFQWFTLRHYPEDEVRCLFHLHPGHGCAWDFDVFVDPQARALPVFAKLWDYCNALLRDAEIHTTLSRIDAFNTVSRRAHARLGAREVGWAIFLVIGRAQLAVFSSKPWLHLSLSDRRIPVWPVSSLVRRGNSTHVSDRLTPTL